MSILELAEFEELNSENFIKTIPDVTVIINTYNFEEYLRDALESILSQETRFSIEILIHDDCSKDSSAEIIRDYCSRYPQRIHGFVGHKNIYGSLNLHDSACFNMEWLKKYARGRYIAYCEGDDYWLDPNKLQLQISYMEEHPECVLTMHDALIKDYRDHTERLMREGETEHDITPEELILQNGGIWPTASMVFAKEVAFFPIWFSECGVDDWPRQLYAITKGKIHYFDKCMSIYRYMHGVSWSKSVSEDKATLMEHWIRMLHFIFQYDKYTKGEFHNHIIARSGGFYMPLIWNTPDYAEYEMLLNSIERRLDGDFSWEIEQLKELYKLIMESDYLTNEILDFKKKHTRTYIYGAGKLAKILGSKMEKAGLTIEGYIVSDGQEIIDERIKIHHISEVGYSTNGFGIIVGTGYSYYLEIKKILGNYALDVLFPFVIDHERI